MKTPRRTQGSSAHIATPSLAGKVLCPIRGETNVERCVACPYLEDAEQSGDALTIHCRPVQTTSEIAQLLPGSII